LPLFAHRQSGNLQKPGKQAFALVAEVGFGVELDAEVRALAVANRAAVSWVGGQTGKPVAA